MWKTCLTLVLLICIQVGAYGPMRPRVGGGADARKDAWPWMVSLHDPTCHFCGGSLISNEWVLSAAHCFVGPDYNVTHDTMHVYLGRLTQREGNRNKLMSTVKRIYIHDFYNETTDDEDNDIALLHLSSPVTYNAHIRPVCLTATGSDFPPGTNSVVIGFGTTLHGDNLPYPGILQQAVVPVVNHTECHNNLTRLMNIENQIRIQNNQPPIYINLRVTNNMICAGFSCGGVDANKGDSGGPLMSQHNSCWVQHGIVSWGIDCGLPDTPGVYTRVSQYQQWITNTIRTNSNSDIPRFVDLNQPPPGPGQQGQRQGCCNIL